MKRPIFIIALGFIIGIIWGLYFNIVPFLFLVLIFLLLIFKLINISSSWNAIRIFKIFINNNTILLILISAFISSIYLNYNNKRYEIIYNKFWEGEAIATVISERKEGEYKNSYKIKLEKFNNQEYKDVYFILKVPKSKKNDLKYGDKIKFNGEYNIPQGSRNYGGFDYKEYLKTQKTYGIFETDKIDIIKKKSLSKIEIFSYNIKQDIITNTNKILPKETRELFLGILIGYDNNLQEELQESFNKSNLTHLLAVSGAHIAYIITGLTYILNKLKFEKKIRSILIILFLILFMYITDFSSSILRATIMGITSLFPTLICRKQDIKTTITFSLLIILISNPHKILDIGLILSYLATIGIILFSKIQKKQKEKLKMQYRIIAYLKELVLITLFANIFVIPIILYNFNTISLTFLISNLIAGIIIGPITIGGFIIIFISFINIKLAYIVAIPYDLLLKILIVSTNIVSQIPLSQIFVPTPNIFFIIIYYLALIIIFLYITLKKSYNNRYIFKKLQKHILIFKNFIKDNKRLIFILILIILITIFVLRLIPKDMKIYFIDVGQGDSTLVITPTNKKILIDSGGSEYESFDVGKSTLFPYLLDRGIISLDYICISHFDSDHCQGFIYLLNNIEVKNIILSKQCEITNNFEEIMRIAKKKNINILRVEDGNILPIDRYVRFNILSPGKDLTEDINDNSIVMKLQYARISFLLTGDISENIEKELVDKYSNFLQSDILKIAHHGSDTSSCKEFIEQVNQKISLIGVGKNNKFRHPSKEVVKRLENIDSKIYRTDLNGEIILRVSRKRKHKSRHTY